MIDAPSGGPPEKAPRWDLTGTEGCSGGNRVSWCSWMFSGYMSIYRRRKYVGGTMRGPQGWARAHPHGACRAPSWSPRSWLDVHSKFPGLHLFQKDRSRRFHYVWTLFDIPFLRNTEIGKKTTIWVGPPVNRLVPKII